MREDVLDEGSIAFQAEGRLLQELGLRLVASPEVALVELVKNAYDADSPSCIVRLEDNDGTLVIVDEGHGMTCADFLTKWMRISTSSKLSNELSPKYSRRLTGAKGIGRFAVRYLGDHLQLESKALDKARACVTKLTAVFDWPRIDAVGDLSKAKIDYRLVRMPDTTFSGTTLRITKLRNTTDFASSRNLRNEVLKMVSPLAGLDRGKFSEARGDKEDPGFKVRLPGEKDAEVNGATIEMDLAEAVLDNYWARLTIELRGRRLTYRVIPSANDKVRELKLEVETSLSKGFFADIRFFPRRKGVFSKKEVYGKDAWNWVRENCGVAVVDHGFRIKPYGFPDDDWLYLDSDAAHNEREWRTEIAKEHFPVPRSKFGKPGENPTLNLANNRQLVGAVFIESARKSSDEDNDDLIPAMDREGLLANEGYYQFQEFVRAGLEFLAHEDKLELDRLAALEAKAIAKDARADIRQAIEYIEQSPNLMPRDKAQIVKHYNDLSIRIEKQEEYSDQSKRGLMTMSMLGVVAGFMMHESKAIVHEMQQTVTQVRALAKKHPELASTVDDLSDRLKNFEQYLEYSRLFVQNVRAPREQPLSASGQVRHIINRFKSFAEHRGIAVTQEIASEVLTPPLPVAVYSGVLLNLYTNALKAVIAVQSSVREPHVCFRAWNEKKKHVVEVADNGVGIPPELRNRIWDPLYTTTSDVGNPLGSGVGLGLTLVKQVVEEYGGKVSIAPDTPPGFNTCFRVEFPCY